MGMEALVQLLRLRRHLSVFAMHRLPTQATQQAHQSFLKLRVLHVQPPIHLARRHMPQPLSQPHHRLMFPPLVRLTLHHQSAQQMPRQSNRHTALHVCHTPIHPVGCPLLPALHHVHDAENGRLHHVHSVKDGRQDKRTVNSQPILVLRQRWAMDAGDAAGTIGIYMDAGDACTATITGRPRTAAPIQQMADSCTAS